MPKSHSIAAITMDDPVKNVPRKNINADNPALLVWFTTARISYNIVAKLIPTKYTGDLNGTKSVANPIGMLPKMAPVSNKLKISAEVS